MSNPRAVEKAGARVSKNANPNCFWTGGKIHSYDGILPGSIWKTRLLVGCKMPPRVSIP